MFKILLLASFSFFILTITSSVNAQKEEYVGIRAAIKLSEIKEFQQHFFLDIINEIDKLNVDNQSFDFDIGIATANVKLENIKLKLNLLKSDEIDISFKGSDIINLKGSNMNVAGRLGIKLNVGILPEYKTQLFVSSNNLNVDADVKLGWTDHRVYPNKKTFHVEITRLDIDIDFEYVFDGAVTSMISEYFNDSIKNAVKSYLKSAIKENILPVINKEIKNQFNEWPIYIPVFNDTLIDYSLLAPPRLENDLLILNTKASFLQKSQINNTDTDPNIGLVKLPPIKSMEKGIKAQVSPNTVNTLIRSLFYSNLLKYDLEIEKIVDVVPEKEGFLNILHPANVLRNLLGVKFGFNTRGRVDFKLLEIPVIKFEKKTFSSNVKILLAFSTEQKDGKMKPFVVIKVDTYLEASGVIRENVEVDFVIKKFLVNSFETMTNDLGLLLTDQIIQFWINFELTNIAERINTKYLRGVKLYIPPIAGMNFNNSKINIFDNFAEVEIGVSFTKRKSMIKKFIQKYIKLR